MSTIVQHIADILAAPAPVICLDTCAILDIARAPARDQAASVEAATTVVRLAGTAIPGIYLLKADFVDTEYQDHLQSARDATGNALNVYSAVADILSSIFAIPSPQVLPPVSQFQQELEDRSKLLLAACRVIDRDFVAMDAAMNRVVAKRKPSSKNQVKDCHIVEHCLAVARGVRTGGFSKSILFVSSNVDDFGQRGSVPITVHRDLAADFAAAGMGYAASLGEAVAALRRTGEIP